MVLSKCTSTSEVSKLQSISMIEFHSLIMDPDIHLHMTRWATMFPKMEPGGSFS